LEAVGRRVVEATNGREALDLIHRDPPDAVLLDLQMPILDGFCVVRQVRSAKRFRSLADLGHVKVGIGASEALAACESIRIFLWWQRVAGRKMVFSSWRSTCTSAESVPIKMSRPFSAPVDLPGPD
jgi:Response regulator receiver domain